MSDAAESWRRAALAIRLLKSGASGLGGAVIRMRAGPAREQVLTALAPLSARRIHPGISTEQLLGGLDLAATLQSGRVVAQAGVLQRANCILLTMAERTPDQLAALLAQHMDQEDSPLVLALDEGAAPDEQLPASLSDRLAFSIAPEGRCPVGWADAANAEANGFENLRPTAQDIETLTDLASRCGIHSLRAPLFAVQVARAHAALEGRKQIAQEDLAAAAELVFAHRATQIPAEEEDQPADPETHPPPDDGTDAGSGEPQGLPDGDILVAAVQAALPDGVLAGLTGGGAARGSGSGAGARRKGNRKGRPLPARPGRLDGQHRIDLVATLRAAAPWQPLRRGAQQAGPGLAIRPADIRVRRFEEHSDRLLIFTVDASGSAALARLNEAKGAVEQLLAQAYAARDHVALVAFRGSDAELLLPPTRSLVQTKRRLSSLPGGGGTPLAAGLQQAMALAEQSRARGLSPTIVLLTDGRSNIALDGSADRARAAADAGAMARALRAQGIEALVIDMSARPQTALRQLSSLMGAPYLALPRADAHRLSGAVQAALGA